MPHLNSYKTCTKNAVWHLASLDAINPAIRTSRTSLYPFVIRLSMVCPEFVCWYALREIIMVGCMWWLAVRIITYCIYLWVPRGCCNIGYSSVTRRNTLGPRLNGRHFPDDIFKGTFLNDNVYISIKISLKFVSNGPINNIPALVQTSHYLNQCWLVYWRICVTRPNWVTIVQSFWNFARRTTTLPSCPVQNVETVRQLANKLRVSEFLRELSLRWAFKG